MYNTNSESQILNRYQFGFLIAIISIFSVANPFSDLFAQSTASISGSVIDSDTKKPLVGANVFIEKSGVGASTDTEGRFLIPSVSDGIYILTCSYIGYEKESITLTIRNGQSPFVEFRIAAKVLEFPQISVIGIGRMSLQRIPGSGTLISSARLLNTKPLSGNEILRQVPGVHVQEEEGLGLRANISIRGLNPDRSRTVLMLEDGVPVALAPYGEPEMYYTPPIDRMSGIEIVKGSGSILFGPQTVGGVINYITVNPRLAPEGRLIFQGGQNGLFIAQGQFTKKYDDSAMLINFLRKQGDSVRSIFFKVTDVLTKMTVNLGARSSLGIKLNVYDEISNSTYVGLTQKLYDTDPNFNPVPDDRLKIRRYSTSTTHQYNLNSKSVLKTTFYAYQTTRNWQRQDYGYSDDGTEIIVKNSTGNRNRTFEVIGLEPRLKIDYKVANFRNEFDGGIRVHFERAHEQRINGETGNSHTGVIRDEEIRSGKAVSGFIQNRIFLNERLRITPGIRVERFSYERNILRTRVTNDDGDRVPTDVDLRSGDDLLEFIPGFGVSYVPNNSFTLFAGAYRGFAPPRIKDAITVTDGGTQAISILLDAERSLNLEVGTRVETEGGFSFETTIFMMDFENQIIPTSESGGAVTDLPKVNQGETEHKGIEGNIGYDFGRLLGMKSSITANLSFTHTEALFSSDRFINGVNVKGFRLPYAPEDILSLRLRYVHQNGLNIGLNGSYVSEQFADNANTSEGSANGRIGLIPSYRIWDFSGQYQLRGLPLRVSFSVKNIFNRKYIASRRPEGIKPGLFRQMIIGFDYIL
ncbi:MAG: TonB-dependent receptor [Candidatus Marinimicrobia bacterium]|nr:TonB-dependent receptor [Candidatus Neomarinimicrobiota bacterium]